MFTPHLKCWLQLSDVKQEWGTPGPGAKCGLFFNLALGTLSISCWVILPEDVNAPPLAKLVGSSFNFLFSASLP